MSLSSISCRKINQVSYRALPYTRNRIGQKKMWTFEWILFGMICCFFQFFLLKYAHIGFYVRFCIQNYFDIWIYLYMYLSVGERYVVITRYMYICMLFAPSIYLFSLSLFCFLLLYISSSASALFSRYLHLFFLCLSVCLRQTLINVAAFYVVGGGVCASIT